MDDKISLAVNRLLLRSERNQGLPCNGKERTFHGHIVREDSCWCWRQRWWLRRSQLRWGKASGIEFINSRFKNAEALFPSQRTAENLNLPSAFQSSVHAWGIPLSVPDKLT